MKRMKKTYSGTLDVSKAAAFFDRLHALKDALENLQAQYAEDIAEVVTELSDAQSVDPALIRMAFAGERQRRKREAKIAKMDSGKAYQLDLLADAAAGSEGIPPSWVTPKAEAPHDPETGEIIETELPRDAVTDERLPNAGLGISLGGSRSIPSEPNGNAARPSVTAGETALNTPREEGAAHAEEAAATVRAVNAAPTRAPEMEIPAFLRRSKPQVEHA